MNFFLSIISGFLIALSFPNFFIPFLFVLGFLIIFFLISKSSFRLSIIYSFLAGLSFYLLSLYWVNNAIIYYGDMNPTVSILLYILLSSVLSLIQFVIPVSLTKILFIRHSYFAFVSFPFLWVWIEIVREFFPFTGFPWNLAGYSLSYINPLAQITEFVGIYGLSFLAVSIPVALFLFFSEKSIFSTVLLIVVSFVLLISTMYGYLKIKNFVPTGEKYKIGVLQGNIPQDMKRDINQKEKIVDIYISLFKKVAKENPDLVVLPESALPFPPLATKNPLKEKFFKEIKDLKIAFLTGYDNFFKLKGKLYLYNSVFLYDENHYSIYFYNKIKLVPFGEYVPTIFNPFKKLFPYLENFDFQPGKEITTLNYKKMRIIPLICFESIFSTFVGNFVKKGGNIIINITNDAWFGKTSAPFQHFEMARVRAIENRLYLVRAANTGISAIVNPVGEIEKSLGLFERGYLVGDVFVDIYKKPTFYLRYRKILILVLFILTLIVIFFKEKDYLNRIKRS
ncbi:MAG: apolipoprotein N-acyltransferase [Aquificae bacterium]|nr:apolipoprotein N-acyltransferase [Aquificota bacterium]